MSDVLCILGLCLLLALLGIVLLRDLLCTRRRGIVSERLKTKRDTDFVRLLETETGLHSGGGLRTTVERASQSRFNRVIT